MNYVKVLPSDVWVEILRRIPAADLVPLKTVCKTFYRLISDDFFTRLHLEDSTKDPKARSAIIISKLHSQPFHSTYYDPDKRIIRARNDKFDYWCSHVWSTAFGSPLPQLSHHQVIDSYHGLHLVQICDRFFLCNPITRSYKFLPSIPGFWELDYYYSCWKIAYDDVSKQYKVFGLWVRSESVSLHVFDVHRDGELHSPRQKIAMEEAGDHKISRLSLVKDSVLVNGNVYWLIITNETETQGSCIVSANITTEEVKIRNCSSTPALDPRYYFAAKGTFYVGHSFNFKKVPLWVLEGVESSARTSPSWMIKHHIYNRYYLPLDLSTVALGMFSGKVLIMFYRQYQYYYCDRLCQYDPSSEEFEEVMVANNVKGRVFFHIVEHIDSLISL